MYAGSPANCTDKHTHALKRDVPLSTSSHRRSPTYATCVPPAALPATVSPPHPHPYTMHPSKLSLPGVCPLQGGHLKGAPPAALLQPQWPPAAGQGGKSRVSTITSPGTAELPPCMHACMRQCQKCAHVCATAAAGGCFSVPQTLQCSDTHLPGVHGPPGQLPSEQLPQHHAKSKQIAGGCGPLAAQHLWRLRRQSRREGVWWKADALRRSAGKWWAAALGSSSSRQQRHWAAAARACVRVSPATAGWWRPQTTICWCSHMLPC